jgi:hypothetical protein
MFIGPDMPDMSAMALEAGGGADGACGLLQPKAAPNKTAAAAVIAKR